MKTLRCLLCLFSLASGVANDCYWNKFENREFEHPLTGEKFTLRYISYTTKIKGRYTYVMVAPNALRKYDIWYWPAGGPAKIEKKGLSPDDALQAICKQCGPEFCSSLTPVTVKPDLRDVRSATGVPAFGQSTLPAG